MEETPDAPQIEDTQPEVTDAASVEASEDGNGNWESRYKDLQSTYTRTSQELAEARQAKQLVDALQSDDTRADALRHLAEQFGEEAVLQALGYDVEGDEDTPDDPNVVRDPRVDELLSEREAEKAQREQDEQMQALDTHVDEQIKAISKELGKDLPESTQRFLVAHAVASLPPGEDGMPQITKAWEDYKAERETWQQEWMQSKKAPHVTTTGVPGEKAIDLSDDQTRRRVTAEIIASHSEDG